MKTREEIVTEIINALFRQEVRTGTYGSGNIPFNEHCYDLYSKQLTEVDRWKVVNLLYELLSSPETKEEVYGWYCNLCKKHIGTTSDDLTNHSCKVEKEEPTQELRVTMSGQKGKPYIVIDDMKQGGKTVFAGRLEHIQKNELFKIERLLK